MSHEEAQFIRGMVPFPAAPTVTVVSPSTTAYAKVTPSANTLKTMIRPRTVTQSLVYAATIVHKIADATSLSATAPAVTEANDFALCIELMGDHNTHTASVAYHVAATASVASTAATSEATLVAQLNLYRLAQLAHYADSAAHGGMTDTVNLAIVAATVPCTTSATAHTLVNVLYPAHVAHLLVLDLGAYVTAGPVGLPIDWPCSAPFYAKTDTSGGVFTVTEWTGW